MFYNTGDQQLSKPLSILTRSVLSIGIYLGMIVSLMTTVEAQVKEWKANQDQVILQDIPSVPATIQASLSQFQNIRSAFFQDWHPNLKSLLITTRFDDVKQLHQVDFKGGARHQLTFFKEPLSSVMRRPNSHEITFMMDSGGNETAQIFALYQAYLLKNENLLK